MCIHRANLANCTIRHGAVVVIDVLRAFSTAAYVFASGAREIFLVRTIEDAYKLRRVIPGVLLIGEEGGLRIPGFDFGNSPTEIIGGDFSGRQVIQCTTLGTRGAVLSREADILLTASFPNAKATAKFIRFLSPSSLTFLITGADLSEKFLKSPIKEGDEDAACADYLENLVTGKDPDPVLYLERARQSRTGCIFTNPNQARFPVGDLELCLAVNKFDFAMQVVRQGELSILTRVEINS